VLKEFKQAIPRLVLVPSKGGCFEVRIGGELIYSKLATGQFPDEATVVAELVRRIRRGR
jgi:selenoprotein W-related protein